MSGELVECGLCGKRDIPPAPWHWFMGSSPIHPWCDPLWDDLPGPARALIEQLARMCKHEPARSAVFAAAGGDRRNELELQRGMAPFIR